MNAKIITKITEVRLVFSFMTYRIASLMCVSSSESNQQQLIYQTSVFFLFFFIDSTSHMNKILL